MSLCFIAESSGGVPTLHCELVEESGCIHLDYEIIAPFVSKGERRRQTWCWHKEYPEARLLGEAVTSARRIADQMWGVPPHT